MHIRDFTKVNIDRLPHFKNAKGAYAHLERKWSLPEWFTATAGELGEAGNIIKKIGRGDFTLHEAREELAAELADTLTYLVILADACGVDLEQAAIRKWNRVSEKVDYPVRLDLTGRVTNV